MLRRTLCTVRLVVRSGWWSENETPGNLTAIDFEEKSDCVASFTRQQPMDRKGECNNGPKKDEKEETVKTAAAALLLPISLCIYVGGGIMYV